ncbi:MAG: hypothetical protein ACPL7B_03155 [Candidatus Poribacteria bacterium]
MRICLSIFLLMLATTAYAQYVSPAIDFFMLGRQYDTFLRDHFQFDEPKPLWIDYNYVKWLNSKSGSSDYSDYLHIETSMPIYNSDRFSVDVPFVLTKLPVWAENDKYEFGDSVNILSAPFMIRLAITDNFRPLFGFEYNIKGDSETFGEPQGKMVCIPNIVLSYNLSKKVNLMFGGRLERYYYEAEEANFAVELDDMLYLIPVSMINWHPSENFLLLLGVPYSGISLKVGNKIRTEARFSVSKNGEIALRLKPIEKTNISLRFINSPNLEIPVEISALAFGLSESKTLKGRFSNTRQNMVIEVGRELNPAALALIGFRYSPKSDLTFKTDENEYELDCPPNFAIGVRFNVDVKALLQME